MLTTVRSYDVFDTIIARNAIRPTDIFDIIEDKFPYKNFKAIRIQSEINNGLTLDNIYNEFHKLTNDDMETINKLKQYEIDTEAENSYLIIPNYEKINDGDILISDMYLSDKQIEDLLNRLGFSKKVQIYSSSIGISKHSGLMYEYLKRKYDILLHTGDNEYSDIAMANKHKIPSCLTTIHKFNGTEMFFIDKGYEQFAFLLRKFRLRTPYSEGSKEYNLYNDQIAFNIPLLILISLDLNHRLVEEKRDTVLFYTRDGCFIKPIFQMLSSFNAVTFHSSRVINKKENPEYDIYIKNTYDDDRCIIFDGHGAFSSGREKYINVLERLPRIHIFSFCRFSRDNLFERLTYNVVGDDTFEKYNVDTIGTLLDYKDDIFIRDENEAGFGYNVDDARIYKQTVLNFIEYYKKENFNEAGLPCFKLIPDFYANNFTPPSININLEPHKKATSTANTINEKRMKMVMSVNNDEVSNTSNNPVVTVRKVASKRMFLSYI